MEDLLWAEEVGALAGDEPEEEVGGCDKEQPGGDDDAEKEREMGADELGEEDSEERQARDDEVAHLWVVVWVKRSD